MKRIFFTLLFFAITFTCISQNTYYWTGGTSGSWGTPGSWNTNLDGSGLTRATPNTADVLIFDGSNIGGATIPVVTGAVSVQPVIETIGQLRIQNLADVSLFRTATTGTTTLTIGGTAGTDLIVTAGSKLLQSGASTSSMVIIMATGTTGEIAGMLFITGGGGSKLSVKDAGGLIIQSGATVTASVVGTNPFSTTTAGTTGSADRAVIFQGGSTFIYQGTPNPFGSSTTNVLVFNTGSNFIFEAGNATNIFSSRVFGNVIIRNNATVSSTETFFNIDTLTINAGATFNLRNQGTSPISGDIINNGTMGLTTAASSAHLVLDGSVPQTISGSGVFNTIGAVSVATDANVTLNKSLVTSGTSTSTITGKLNLQTFTISGSADFTARAAQSATVNSTITAGSHTVTLNTAIYASGVNLANVSIGMLVTGIGIQPNSYIIATNSGGSTFTLSKPATATSASTDATSITITGKTPSIITANPGGIDAAIATSGVKTFGSGTGYTFNVATTSPFSTASNNTVGDITVNANITTNKVVSTSGAITLNNAKLTIRPVDTLYLNSSASFGGTFNSTSYIVTDVSGSSVGPLAVNGFTAATTFPVGTSNYYMPVTLTPTTASNFAVSVFQGITEDGTPTGTPFTPAKKSRVVDAVWTINRMSSNSDDVTVTLNWPSALEGSEFASSNNIGVARDNAGTWEATGGTGNNTTNTATNTFTQFSPFGVGIAGGPLPLMMTNLVAKKDAAGIRLTWNNQFDQNTTGYIVERSENGRAFSSIGSVVLNGRGQYNWIDNNPFAAINFYRIGVKDIAGNITYSNVVRVNSNEAGSVLSVYPNPVTDGQLNIQLSNLNKGTITMSLINYSGQTVFNSNIQYNGGIQSQTIQLPSNISKGSYLLILNTGEQSLTEKVVIQ